MNDLAQNLIEELQCETVFTIPILGGIPVSEAVVVTWIIMAVLVVVSFILTRNLKVDHISKRQAIGAGIAVLGSFGAGIGIGIATGRASEAVARQPEAEGKITKTLILGSALAEATAIYGFVIALMIIVMLA